MRLLGLLLMMLSSVIAVGVMVLTPKVALVVLMTWLAWVLIATHGGE